MGLTGPQAQAFIKALVDRYTKRLDELDLLLRGLDKTLDEFRSATALPLGIIATVVDEADREGWLRDLYRVALAEVPALGVVGAELGWESAVAVVPPAALPVYDPASILGFDLVPLEQEFLRVRVKAASRLVGFAVTYGEDPFLRFFCERLQALLKRESTHVQERLALGGRFGASAQVNRVKSYEPMLGYKNLVCPVTAEDATAAELEGFWQGVRATFADPAKDLVMLFTVLPSTTTPEGVAMLPEPVFTGVDIGDWTTRVATDRGWDPLEGYQWGDFIKKRAGAEGRLDIRMVYDYLQMTMPFATFGDLQAEIEKWRSYAVPASG